MFWRSFLHIMLILWRNTVCKKVDATNLIVYLIFVSIITKMATAYVDVNFGARFPYD